MFPVQSSYPICNIVGKARNVKCLFQTPIRSIRDLLQVNPVDARSQPLDKRRQIQYIMRTQTSARLHATVCCTAHGPIAESPVPSIASAPQLQ